MTALLYRPKRTPYRRGSPIISLGDLHDAAQTLWVDCPVIWSAWPYDDTAWATTTSASLVDLHLPMRLPVLPWVREIRAKLYAHDADIQIEDGASLSFSDTAIECRDITLSVTAAAAGSTRTTHRLRWQRRTTEAECYGLVPYQLGVIQLPEETWS